MYKKVKLDNGLKIIGHPMPDRESLSLGIWINAGARYEPSATKGISHFLEHILFKGSKKFSCRRIKESIEGIGGYLNGFTSEELTCYLVKVPCRHLTAGLEVLADMVLHPRLPAQEIEKEKKVVLEEIKMHRDLPQSYVHELLDQLLWPGQPLGEPIIGTERSIKAIDRPLLSAFKEKYYSTPNMVVSVAGKFDFDRFTALVEKTFRRSDGTGASAFLKAREKQARPQLKIFPKDTEQTHLAMGFHALSRGHSLKYALSLLHIILGANMSSRLFNELREKRGLAYDIGTSIRRFNDTGAFIVHAGIDNRKVPQTLQLILKELQKTLRGPVTPGEFKRAKEFYLGQLALALEDTMEYMLWIGEYTAALDKTYTLDEVIRQVRAVTLEDIRKASRHIFKEEKLNLALIGPLEGRDNEIYRRLKFN
ncbi:MAG: insulinase family protein [Candidatus Omnitrophica bacterium]|nr:insulinase family protein [Candidatus Omnitrophota bacterium]